MSEPVVVAAIGQVAATIAALAAFVEVRRTRRVQHHDGRDLSERMAIVETKIDGLTTDVGHIKRKMLR